MPKIYPKFLTVTFLIFVLAALNLVFQQRTVFAWDNLSGGDHGGTSWSPANGAYIAGVHTNIDTFTVAAGTTVYIQPYNGASYGSVGINANNINIQGTLTASGAGYGGGGGSGGGGGNNFWCCPEGYGAGGAGGSGIAGGGSGGTGWSGNHFCAGEGYCLYHSWSGTGGNGGGPWGGAGAPMTSAVCCPGGSPRVEGRSGHPGASGANGGYSISQGNGDTTTDESVLLGSGGGGGSGGTGGFWEAGVNTGGGAGGGGGAGNPGGGYIKLYASNSISVGGAINTTGLAGARGNGATPSSGTGIPAGQGGHAGSAGSSVGGSGGGGGSGGAGGSGGSGATGAGGGVLLKAESVSVTGSINALGGGGSATNGGTVKIFYGSGSWSGISSGRTYTSQLPPNAPSNLTASSISESQINLSWTDNSNSETGFKIERSLTSGSGFSQIATTTASVTSYNDTGLNPDTTYYYRVRAYNTAGNSDYSNEASATTQSQSPLEASLISSVFDTFVAGGAAINTIMWQGVLNGGEVKFQLASSATSSGPWDYKGWDGSASSYYTPQDAGIPIQINPAYHNNHRYFRYKIFLYTDQARTQSPRVDDVIINWSP